MKKVMLIAVVLLSSAIYLPHNVYADEPYQLSFCYPLQAVERTKNITGISYNFIYGISNDVSGLDFGMINQVDGVQKGVEIGLINSSFKTKGVQIGFFNKTEYLEGLQIGLLNFHNEGHLKVMPFVNWQF